MDSQSQVSQAIPKARVRFGRIHVATGINMHYAEYGDPSGDPIVFLHGYSDSWFSFSPVLNHLDGKQHVFMLDQRGHGNSSQPKNGYAISNFAQDAVAFMDAMALERVTLIGHSMGSIVAQRVAAIAPQQIARLVLAGTTVNPYTDDLVNFLALVNTLEDPVDETFVREFQISTLYGTVTDEFLNQVVAASMKLSAHIWRFVLSELLAYATVSDLKRITAPTLIVWGDRDAIWPYSEQEKLLHGIATAELRVYTETGHAIHWEQPTQFAHDLETFIAQTSEPFNMKAQNKPKA